MRLRGIDFGYCMDASGLRGFFGEGYWYHHFPIINKLWFNFEGSTFVSKTTNYELTPGYMPLTNELTPRELFPKCIWVDLFGQKALNAVGLSGPGAERIFHFGFGYNMWPADKPFMISIAPEGKTRQERLESFKKFINLLKLYHRLCKDLTFGLQVNISCPNSKTDPAELAGEATDYLDLLAELDMPIIIKVNLLVPIAVLGDIAKHPTCDAICFSNTIPFGELSDKLPWKKWFPKGSPLAKFGGGGLSGAPLFELVKAKLEEVRKAGILIPLIVGGGITKPEQVSELTRVGLYPHRDAISIGSVAFLRPWNIPGIIRRAKAVIG